MKSASDRWAAIAIAIAVLASACEGGSAPAPTGETSAASSPLRCADCHRPEFEATNHPPHPNARPITCGVCHTQTSWHGWRVDPPASYPLTGAHMRAAADKALAGKENQVKCFWCHRGDPATWRSTTHACVGCHEDALVGVTHPDHSQFAERNTCETCHTTEAWKPATREPPRARVEPVDAGPPPAIVTSAPKPAPLPVPVPAPVPKPTATHTARPLPTPDVTSRASRR